MELVFATHNPNKLKEIQALMPHGIEVKSLNEIGCTEDIIESAETIAGNALLKAKHVAEKYKLDCFADDTGLEVDLLDGAPGVYSARYAGAEKKPEENRAKLLEVMKGAKNRKAQFRTVITLILNGKEHQFEGICKGTITETAHGTGGFGYDSIFRPDGYEQTFAEMPLALKSKIGHRGKAVEKLLDFLKGSTNLN